MQKSRQEILHIYLKLVADDCTWPLQNHVQKASDNFENTRYHLQHLIKDGVLDRNETKHIIPGPKFIPTLHSLGVLDKWLLSPGAPLLLSQLGGRMKTLGQTRVGVVTSVEEDRAYVVWVGSDNEGAYIKRSTLRRVWPVEIGNRIYATQYTTKYQGFVKEDR